ncbi:hypothetical protein KY495_21540 [Massilia sp. PAMC28688]|uniref:hypothetical protein n=1 Tax=Massilia sp. PAMC28688 TaxID=2861283 RepID=UPI001C62F421|nr:hypothetical protein [Massilia sp. PAMC28688]QYF93231.1 hypothetical protein KY495_21540 [Massilia sp. PAMC28688]
MPSDADQRAARQADQFIRFSRRGLWMALLAVTTLAACALAINLYPGAAAMTQRLMMLMPVAIVIAVVAVGSSLRGVSASERAAGMRRLHDDELRRQSVATGCRYALVAVMLAQPLLALLLTMVTMPYPVLLMASASAFVGLAVLLGAMLLLDR